MVYRASEKSQPPTAAAKHQAPPLVADSNEYLQLVNTQGECQGFAEKLSSHRNGQLHLAFSVMFYRQLNKQRYFHLQKRAQEKYHSGGLWTNTCCSHPRPGESLQHAARRRLNEELGFDDTVVLKQIGHILYKAELDNGFVEHEYDEILLAQVQDVACVLNPGEVQAARWWSEEELEQALRRSPGRFTVWMPMVYRQVIKYLNSGAF